MGHIKNGLDVIKMKSPGEVREVRGSANVRKLSGRRSASAPDVDSRHVTRGRRIKGPGEI